VCSERPATDTASATADALALALPLALALEPQRRAARRGAAHRDDGGGTARQSRVPLSLILKAINAGQPPRVMTHEALNAARLRSAHAGQPAKTADSLRIPRGRCIGLRETHRRSCPTRSIVGRAALERSLMGTKWRNVPLRDCVSDTGAESGADTTPRWMRSGSQAEVLCGRQAGCRAAIL
jgi:hypothetical protein